MSMPSEAGTASELIVPDFSEVKDQVEPGNYKVRVVDSKMDQWVAKDGSGLITKFINWTFETFDEKDEKNNGRRIWHKTPVTGKGAFRLQDFYKAAMGEACPTEGFDRTAVHGRTLLVTIIDGIDRQTKQPTGYTEVKTVAPLKNEH